MRRFPVPVKALIPNFDSDIPEERRETESFPDKKVKNFTLEDVTEYVRGIDSSFNSPIIKTKGLL